MEDEETTPAELDAGIIMDLDRLNELKLEKKSVEDEIDYLQAALIKAMNAAQASEALITDHRGNPLKATVVSSSTESVDMDYLENKLQDHRLVEAITERTVSTAKLKKAKELGLFDDPIHAKALIRKPKKPYILFTAPIEEGTDDE